MAARKLTVYLPPTLDAKVRKAAREQHRSESSIVLEALKARLERGEATNAGIEESACDLVMGDGGRADADQIDLAQQLAPIGHDLASMLGGDGGAGLRRWIGDGEQLDIAVLGQGRIFGGMVTAEGTRPDDGGFQRTRFRHTTTKKQRQAPER